MTRGEFSRATFFLFGVLFFMSLILADPTITTSSGSTSYSVDEDVSSIYNVTVNNADTLSVANISQVNISLPASFTFSSNTNDTSSSASASFSSSSGVLSWEGDNLVGNLTSEYFWFNATASTPGDYNLTVTVLNDTGLFTTNLSVSVADTTAPTITLSSPVDSTSSTTTAYNFTFTVSDVSSVSSCALYLDGEAINNLTTVNGTGGTNGMYNSSLAVATYTWGVNCTDSSGNEGTSSSRTLTVSATPSSSSSSSSNSRDELFRPSKDELMEGYQDTFKKDWEASFYIGNELHRFTVDEISSDGAHITLSSDPLELFLLEGEEKKVDLNADNQYDFLVRLDELTTISRGNAAVFTLRTISEPISSSPALDNDSVEEIPIEERPSEQNPSPSSEQLDTSVSPLEESSSFGRNVIVFLILILVGVAGYYFFLQRRTPKRRTKK